MHHRPIEQMGERCRCGIFRPFFLFHVARVPATVFHGNRNSRTVVRVQCITPNQSIRSTVCPRMQHSQCDVISISKRFASIREKKIPKIKILKMMCPPICIVAVIFIFIGSECSSHQLSSDYASDMPSTKTAVLSAGWFRLIKHISPCFIPFSAVINDYYLSLLLTINEYLLMLMLAAQQRQIQFKKYCHLVRVQCARAVFGVRCTYQWPHRPYLEPRSHFAPCTSHVERIHRFTHNISRVSRVNSCNFNGCKRDLNYGKNTSYAKDSQIRNKWK